MFSKKKFALLVNVAQWLFKNDVDEDFYISENFLFLWLLQLLGNWTSSRHNRINGGEECLVLIWKDRAWGSFLRRHLTLWREEGYRISSGGLYCRISILLCIDWPCKIACLGWAMSLKIELLLESWTGYFVTRWHLAHHHSYLSRTRRKIRMKF